MKSVPCVLSIAGSDSGGGAGIQADLRAFRTFHTFGTTAITAITAQNPTGVRGIAPVPVQTVIGQIQAVLDVFPVKAVKTGMLYSSEIVLAVSDILASFSGPVIVDPVMISTSGSTLLAEDALESMTSRFLHRADWITPNLPETEFLLGRKLDSFAQFIEGGAELSDRYHAGIVIKGGHSTDPERAEDLIFHQGNVWRLSAPRLTFPPHASHGTGCSFSSALAAAFASGMEMQDAFMQVKAFIQKSLQCAIRLTPELGVMPPDLTAPFSLNDITMEKL